MTPVNFDVSIATSPCYNVEVVQPNVTLDAISLAGQGPRGDAATITVGTTTTSAPGSPADVENVGDEYDAIFNFTIPTGPSGPPGSPGSAGSAATIVAGTTTTLAPGSNATVSNSGTVNAAVFDFGIPSGLTGAQGATGAGLTPKGYVATSSALPPSGNTKGDLWIAQDTVHAWSWNGTAWVDMGSWQGPAGSTGIAGPPGNAGAPGSPGAAATIAAGTATGLPAGSSPTVNNSGSSSAAVFNFGIPAGATGAQGIPGVAGSPGSPGSPGAAGANSWTLSSASFTVPPVGSTATMSVSDTSWAVVGEYVWVAGAGGSPSSPMALQITAKTSTTLTLLNPPSAGTQPSGDANNLLTTGSDSLLYLPPSAIQPTIGAMRLRSFNAIGNPNFEVDQRNVGAAQAAIASFKFIEDRWAFQKSGGSTHVETAQVMTNQRIVVQGTNFLISSAFLRLTLTTQQTSLGAGDFGEIYQSIEGPMLRELFGDVHSLQVLVRSSVAGQTISINLRDSPATYSLVASATLTNANQWYLLQFPNLPVFTASSSNWSVIPGNIGYIMGICLGSGSTFTAPSANVWNAGNFLAAPGTTNWMASPVNSTFDIAFVQHEPGSQCTTLIDKPFSQNLDECLRYYQKSYNYAVAVGGTSLVGYASGIIPVGQLAYIPGVPLQKSMAKAPTVTAYNYSTGAANSVYNNSAATSVSTSSVQAAEKEIQTINLSASQTAGQWIIYHYTADTGW